MLNFDYKEYLQTPSAVAQELIAQSCDMLEYALLKRLLS